jgi:hypothetical protein
MSIDGAIARPPRCVLVNVTSGESMECLFNPTQLSEKLQVNWNRLAVPGLSHQVLQFQSTANRQLSGVEFYLDRYFAAEQPGDVNILEFRAFLRALTVPPEAPRTSPPPRRRACSSSGPRSSPSSASSPASSSSTSSSRSMAPCSSTPRTRDLRGDPRHPRDQRGPARG